LLLLALGLLMVTSASMPIAERQTGQPFYFLIRQGVFVLIGLLLAGGVVFQVPCRTLARWGQFVPAVGGDGLLMLVLIPGIGKEVNGSLRWIGVGSDQYPGLGTGQAVYADLHRRLSQTARGAELQTADFRTSALALFRPMAVLAVLAVLLLLEPDFGSVVVLMATAMGMVFLAGGQSLAIWVLLFGTAAAMAVLLGLRPIGGRG
jgi:cell division protein FtsW